MGIAALAVIIVAALTRVAGAAEGGYIGVRGIPAPGEAMPDASLLVRVESGSTITRRVAVSNTTSTPMTIALSVGPADVQHGAFVFGDPGAQNDTSTWARMEPDHLLVEPGTERMATVRITVPSGAADGVRYGVVWAQPPAADGGGVQMVNRVGVRLAVSVGSLATTGAQLAVTVVVGLIAVLVGAMLVLLARRFNRRTARA